MLKCSKCKIERSKNLFIKNGKTLKSCGVCRGVVIPNPQPPGYSYSYSSSSSSDESQCKEDDEDEEDEEDEKDELYCPVCNKYFDTESQVIKHSQSAIHKKRLTHYNN